jgi:hypothetical protein
MSALSMMPIHLQETLREHGQVANVPHIGHPDNCVFPNVQMNIAFPVCETASGKLIPFKNQFMFTNPLHGKMEA